MPAVALAMCAFTFTSCDDDDDEYRMPTGPAATYAGKLVTGVGSYKFHYDDNNRCYKVTSSYGDVVMIDYKRGTISLESEDEEKSRTAAAALRYGLAALDGEDVVDF